MSLREAVTVSKLAVQVVRKTSDGDELIDNFRKVTFVEKPMPRAIWEVYDPALDPQNKPASLLNGDSPAVNQCMGVAFAPPKPKLSPPPMLDGYGFFTPKFKASAAGKFGILDFRPSEQKPGLPANSKDGTTWFVPESEEDQVKYLPKAWNVEEKAMQNRAQWDNTRTNVEWIGK
jgi:hypothetical protein